MSKQCQTATTTLHPLQRDTELHQKDLRINLETVQILGPGTEVILEADTNLALSLIVRFYASDGSITARRVDIQYPRPCRKVEITQNVRILNI